MPRRPLPRLATLALPAALAVSIIWSAAANEGDSLDGFLNRNVPLCMKAPAARCIDQGFAFVDADGDGRLSPDEVRATQAQVDLWVKSHARQLPQGERERLIMGLVIVRAVGPDQLFASYDSDGDGLLTREEVTADIRLDRRPLPEILSDPAAIDWNGLAARAGEAAPLLKRLFDL